MVISHKMVVGWGEVGLLATHCHWMNKSSHAAQRPENRKWGVTRGKRVIGNVWLSIRNTKMFWSARLSAASGLESNYRPLTHILMFIFLGGTFQQVIFFTFQMPPPKKKKLRYTDKQHVQGKRTKWRRTRRRNFDERCNFMEWKCTDCSLKEEKAES